MSRWYLDTSAAVKLIVTETESAALVTAVDAERPDLLASALLETELRRVVQRQSGLTHEAVSQLLGDVSLFELPPSLFREAGMLPGASLPSLDALHLASALRIRVDHVVTYDARMADSARSLGFSVLAPGSSGNVAGQ